MTPTPEDIASMTREAFEDVDAALSIDGFGETDTVALLESLRSATLLITVATELRNTIAPILGQRGVPATEVAAAMNL